MEHLLVDTTKLLSASVPANLQIVYRNALSAFTIFRRRYNFPDAWPSPVEHVALFISYCFATGYSPSTIATYVSGISFYHKIHNLEDPTAVFIVKKLLEGFRRTRQRRDVRAPITVAILQKVCSVLPDICFSTYESCLFKAAYLVAYFGLLRVSEIVFTNQINANRPLLYSDVQVTDGSQAVLISIRVSKTKQSGAPTILRIPRSGNPSLCCVTAVQNYLHLRPCHPQYFFSHMNGSPLTRSQFTGVLAKAIRCLGLPIQVYTSHSFRIGRASDLASKGLSNETIKQLGRWKSDAVERYIRL